MPTAFLHRITPRYRLLREYTEVLVVIAFVTIAGWFAPVSYWALGQFYLLAVIVLSMHLSRWPALAAAVVSGIAWNFVFVPPRLSFSVLHFDDGILLGTYFLVALIGGQVAVLRAAAARAKLLAESERLHQTLFDSMAHELKTPIAVVRSAAEQLGTEDPARRERLAQEIHAAAQRLDSLVSNLLNHTRLESGVLKPQMDWCDAHDLVAAARRALGERLKGRPLEVDIPNDLPLLLADAPMMEQVIANLLLNAAVHTPAGLSIQVSAGCLADPARVFIRITDEGPGIPPELKEIIFEKFQRGKSARQSGLGLGLSIVKGFMLAQGGDVSAESRSEGGAQFTVLLPRANPGNVPHI